MVLVVQDSTSHESDEFGQDYPQKFERVCAHDTQKGQSKKKAFKRIHDLVFVCIRRDDDGCETIEKIHHINDSGNNGVPFIIGAWDFLLRETNHFKNDPVFHVFNDGCVMEHKNKYYQYYNSTIYVKYAKHFSNVITMMMI